MNNKGTLGRIENLFSALADQTRLRLLNLMREDEVCVCFFSEVLEESQPKISRHLAYLRKHKIVTARRDGKWMHYRISSQQDEAAGEILENTLNWLAEQTEMQEEYEKLARICCVEDVPITIAKAPKPETFAEIEIALPETENREELETFLL